MEATTYKYPLVGKLIALLMKHCTNNEEGEVLTLSIDATTRNMAVDNIPSVIEPITLWSTG